MSEEKVKLKLKNKDLLEEVNAYFNKYRQMKNLGNLYVARLEESGHTDVKAIYNTNYTEATHELVGFQIISKDESKWYQEIRHSDLNTFKKGKTYQPLKKNKFNKETTQNFELTKVTYKPLLNVIYGEDDPLVFVNDDPDKPYFRVKAVNMKLEDGDFIVEIERRDMTAHTLEHFEVLGYIVWGEKVEFN